MTGGREQDHPQGKEMQKGKWLSEEALQIAVERREAKGKGEKERYTHLNTEFQRIARRGKKALLFFGTLYSNGYIFPFEYRVPKNSKER